MNRARENNLWGWLRAGIPPGAHVQRVENCVAEGTPDVEGMLPSPHPSLLHRPAIQFWLELKSVPRQTLINTELKSTQAQFIKRRVAAGGNAYILIQVGVASVALRYLIHGRHAYDLLRRIDEADLALLATVQCRRPEDVFDTIQYG